MQDVQSDQISIRVDAETARAYRAASEDERRKIDALLRLKLRSVTRSSQSLKQLMDEASRIAEGRGLTPELLDSLLNER